MVEARPTLPGAAGPSGAERRMSGGIGAKLVDCTWATGVSGLIVAVSVKSINFRDDLMMTTDGDTCTMRVGAVWDLDDGLIVDEYIYYDPETVLACGWAR